MSKIEQFELLIKDFVSTRNQIHMDYNKKVGQLFSALLDNPWNL